MAILEDEVIINLQAKNIKHYEKLGYHIPRRKDKQGKLTLPRGTEIKVKVKDLPKGSITKLTRICDQCGDITPDRPYNQIVKYRENGDGKDRCRKCCNVTSENYIAKTHPEIAKLLKIPQRGYEIISGTTQKEIFICDKCGFEQKKIVRNVVRYRFSCSRCDDGLPYGEKFMMCVLNQLDIEYETQKMFDWSSNIEHENSKLHGNKIYDFYIPSLNLIIETHGEQHYRRGFEYLGGRNLEEEQENDRIKEGLAKENGFENYIILDCSESNLKYIKNSIISSKLSDMFNLKGIDWKDCVAFTCTSLVKLACSMWRDGIKNTTDIGNELKLGRSTIWRYLQRGVEIRWIEYDSNEVWKNVGKVNSQKRRKSVVQFTIYGDFIKEWDSAMHVQNELGINGSDIASVCKGKHKTAGGFRWLYEKDYDKSNPKIKLIKIGAKREIIQLSLNMVILNKFDSIVEASKCIGTSTGNIQSVCKGRTKTAGGFIWMYKEDYEKYQMEAI